MNNSYKDYTEYSEKLKKLKEVIIEEHEVGINKNKSNKNLELDRPISINNLLKEDNIKENYKVKKLEKNVDLNKKLK